MTLLSTLFFLFLSVNMASCHFGPVNQNREFEERVHEQRRIGQTRIQDRQPRSVSTLNVLDFSADGDQQPDHWCLAANFRIIIYNGEMVFNRLLSNSWPVLDDFFRKTPMKFRFGCNGEKISPIARLRAKFALRVYRILAYFDQKCFGFFSTLFSFEHINLKLSGINHQC